tara:strand:- start:1440 stop:1967 length:528 start_codon:yes stop_codon:yes gene_type:complete
MPDEIKSIHFQIEESDILGFGISSADSGVKDVKVVRREGGLALNFSYIRPGDAIVMYIDHTDQGAVPIQVEGIDPDSATRKDKLDMDPSGNAFMASLLIFCLLSLSGFVFLPNLATEYLGAGAWSRAVGVLLSCLLALGCAVTTFALLRLLFARRSSTIDHFSKAVFPSLRSIEK